MRSFSPFFARRRIATLEPEIRGIAISLIDQVKEHRTAEVVHDLALPMVVRSFAVVVGRPQDTDEWMSWGVDVWKVLEDGTRTSRHVDEYLSRVFHELAKNPGPDVFSAIATARVGERPLTRLEMLGLGNLVLAGGRDTLVQLLSFIVWHLATHPEARDRLAAQPADWTAAVEELLRFTTPLSKIGRIVREDMADDAGQWIAGTRVGLNFVSANHDPSIFTAPAELNLERQANHHVAFGYGPPACLGAHLARLEARVFAEELVIRAPNLNVGGRSDIQPITVCDVEIPHRVRMLDIEVGS